MPALSRPLSWHHVFHAAKSSCCETSWPAPTSHRSRRKALTGLPRSSNWLDHLRRGVGRTNRPRAYNRSLPQAPNSGCPAARERTARRARYPPRQERPCEQRDDEARGERAGGILEARQFIGEEASTASRACRSNRTEYFLGIVCPSSPLIDSRRSVITAVSLRPPIRASAMMASDFPIRTDSPNCWPRFERVGRRRYGRRVVAADHPSDGALSGPLGSTSMPIF